MVEGRVGGGGLSYCYVGRGGDGGGVGGWNPN